MPNRDQFKVLSITRFKEAKILYKKGLYDGAYYILGYVLEMGLKARICKLLDGDYPDRDDSIGKLYKNHNHAILTTLAGLDNKLKQKKDIDDIFDTNWSKVINWSVDKRYQPIGTVSKTEVEDMLLAFEDKNHGVLTWLKKLW